MRVIAGKFKGRRINLPKNIEIRPTKDMVKEALFSILGRGIKGASFLELFAGSGSVGIEALSRGAEKVYFVENSRLCIETIEKNLKRIGIEYSLRFARRGSLKETCAILLPLEAEGAIVRLCQKEERFDFIYLDPPYRQENLKNCLIKISHCDILKPQSWVIAEHNKDEKLPHLLDKLRLMFTRGYGKTVLSFYQREE